MARRNPLHPVIAADRYRNFLAFGSKAFEGNYIAAECRPANPLQTDKQEI